MCNVRTLYLASVISNQSELVRASRSSVLILPLQGRFPGEDKAKSIRFYSKTNVKGVPFPVGLKKHFVERKKIPHFLNFSFNFCVKHWAHCLAKKLIFK